MVCFKGQYPFKHAFISGIKVPVWVLGLSEMSSFLSLVSRGKGSTAQWHGGMAQLNVQLPFYQPQRFITTSHLAVNYIRHF